MGGRLLARICCALAVLWLSFTATGQQLGFSESYYQLPTGSMPLHVAVADLNGDGKPDVVSSNVSGSTGSISVFLNHGQGSLQLAGSFATDLGHVTRWSQAGDLDGDRIPDLVAANDESISVLRGNGTGGFVLLENLPNPGYTRSVHLGDVNLDGTLDLVSVANNGSGNVRLGNGDGTFAPLSYCGPTGGYNPTASILTDLTADGLLDFGVVFHFINWANVNIKLGTGGENGFECTGGPTFIAEANNLNSLAAADLDGDGVMDLAVAGHPCCNDVGLVDILLGTNTGHFTNPAGSLEVGGWPEGVALGDLDLDGDTDIVTGNVTSNRVSVVLGDGRGNFAGPMEFTLSGSPRSVALADMDGDGRVDIVTANSSSDSVSVLLNHVAEPKFGPPQSYPVGVAPWGLVTADFNADGHLDLASANSGSTTNQLSLLFGDGNGGFTPSPASYVGEPHSPRDITTVHFNICQDPIPPYLDVALTLPFNGGHSVCTTFGGVAGNFPTYGCSDMNTTGVPSMPHSVVAADFDQDGHDDLAVTRESLDAPIVLFGDCAGGTSGAAEPVVGSGQHGLVAADFNGDSYPDLAVTYGNQIRVLPYAGGRSFAQGPQYAVQQSAAAVAASDLNLDGASDLVVVDPSNKVRVLIGTGMGSFTTLPFITVAGGACSLVIRDFDQDGKPDLAIAHDDSNLISVLSGDGTGNFGVRQLIQDVFRPKTIVSGDFDHDGALDLAVSNELSDEVTVFLNTSITPMPVLAGTVYFEDGRTPVGTDEVIVTVSAFAHASHQPISNTSVQSDGSFTFPAGSLPPGEYDLLAVVRIPEGFWYSEFGNNPAAYQPANLAPDADVVISPTGQATPSTLDFQLAWPAVLLHGLVVPASILPWMCPPGPEQFKELQPFLSASLESALEAPRNAVIPLVLDMSSGCLKTIYEAYVSAVPQVEAVRDAFDPATRFQLLGYSQGGLVARLLLDDPAGTAWIERAIHVGTPNGGTCAAVVACKMFFTSHWGCLLTPREMAKFNRSHWNGHGVPHYLLAGTLFHPLSTLHQTVNDCLPGITNDSWVPASSVQELTTLHYVVAEPMAEVLADHASLVSDDAAMAVLRAWLIAGVR